MVETEGLDRDQRFQSNRGGAAFSDGWSRICSSLAVPIGCSCASGTEISMSRGNAKARPKAGLAEQLKLMSVLLCVGDD